jgi:ribosomal protein S21
MRRNNNFKNNNKQQPLDTQVTVRAEECRGDADRMVRRFCKKVKKDGIIEELRERRHFTKKSAIKAEERRQTKRLIRKVNMRSQALLKTRR